MNIETKHARISDFNQFPAVGQPKQSTCAGTWPRHSVTFFWKIVVVIGQSIREIKKGLIKKCASVVGELEDENNICHPKLHLKIQIQILQWWHMESLFFSSFWLLTILISTMS